MSDLNKLTKLYLEEITKVAGKDKVNRNKMLKNLENAKSEHRTLKAILSNMEAEHEKLTAQIAETKQNYSNAKSLIKKLHTGLQEMDLANADDVVYYDNDDVGYLIEGKEYHLDFQPDGELTLTPMGKFRRSKNEKNDEPEEVEISSEVKPSEEEDILSFLTR